MRNDVLISVIIPTFRALEYLKICLPEYLKCRNCEIIVALDGFNCNYVEYLAKQPVVISMTRHRQGLCTATNLAARHARGKYLLLCNDDMVPAPGWDKIMLELAGDNKIVSGTVWEPGLIEVPPCHQKHDYGHDPNNFRHKEFIDDAAKINSKEYIERGINYPFLIDRSVWEKTSGLDERFNPGSASDPDFFIRAALLDPAPEMIRARDAVFYHFAGRSSIFPDGKVSISWKIHWKHSRWAFKKKWGRMWEHRFGQVPDITGWKNIKTKKEQVALGKIWRHLFFGWQGRYEILSGIADK